MRVHFLVEIAGSSCLFMRSGGCGPLMSSFTFRKAIHSCAEIRARNARPPSSLPLSSRKVPDTKYSFDHPEGTGHADSPFAAVWYVHCGGHTEAVFQGATAERRGGVSVLRSLDELSRVGAVTTERRLNPRQRKALKRKRNAAASGGR